MRIQWSQPSLILQLYILFSIIIFWDIQDVNYFKKIVWFYSSTFSKWFNLEESILSFVFLIKKHKILYLWQDNTILYCKASYRYIMLSSHKKMYSCISFRYYILFLYMSKVCLKTLLWIYLQFVLKCCFGRIFNRDSFY